MARTSHPPHPTTLPVTRPSLPLSGLPGEEPRSWHPAGPGWKRTLTPARLGVSGCEGLQASGAWQSEGAQARGRGAPRAGPFPQVRLVISTTQLPLARAVGPSLWAQTPRGREVRAVPAAQQARYLRRDVVLRGTGKSTGALSPNGL